MKKFKTNLKSITAMSSMLIFAFAFILLSGCKDEFVSPPSPTGTTILASVKTDTSLNILYAALGKTNQAASLDNNNSGQFTLFAPTDSAFTVYFQAKLPKPSNFNEDSVLLYISNMAQTTGAVSIVALSNILTYHILSSELPSSAIVGNGQVQATLQNARLSISKSGSLISLNANQYTAIANASGAHVQIVDADASNGVYHTISRVMVPITTTNVLAVSGLGLTVSYATTPPTVGGGTSSNLVDTDWNLYAAVIKKSGLAPTILPNVTPLPDFTVFAPNDGAFRLYIQTLKGLGALPTEAQALAIIQITDTNDPNYISVADLAALVNMHLVPGRYVSTDFSDGSTLSSSTTLTFGSSGTTVSTASTTATIVRKDQLSNAGILQGIDAVLE